MNIDSKQKTSVVAIVPAAGTSSRMGVLDKLLLPVSGVPLLKRTVASVVSLVDEVVVVVSLGRAVEVTELLEGQAQVVVNPRPSSGIGSSIAAGVRNTRNADGYLILPGDMPSIKRETIALLLERFRASPDRITLPVRDGRRGRPVIHPSWARHDLAVLLGEAGDTELLAANEDHVMEVDVFDTGIWADIDRPDDYHALVSSL